MSKIDRLRRTKTLALMVSLFPSSMAAQPTQERPDSTWPGYQFIMWHTKTPQQYQALRRAGVTAAMVPADRSGETPERATQKSRVIDSAGLGIYVENIATDFYSSYHRWFPDHPVNWKFRELKKRLEANPEDKSVFYREPSLADQAELAQIKTRLRDTVRAYSTYRPLFFNLADEIGIADLSAAWDFDLSPQSLFAMRVWLRERYQTLAALNQEWSTRFQSWDDIIPMTTRDAMMRNDSNYASWSDFKEWMDVSFARSIGEGTNAIHAGAGWARSAIEGAQKPGWGGYDYSLLSPAVDVMEIYDDGSNLELARSFNPRLVILTTPNWKRANALHTAWSEFLRGARGMILWDPKDEFVTPQGILGPQGQAAATFMSEMHNGIGALLMASPQNPDPIAVLYSPVSFRIQWMLDHRALGASWSKRSAAEENEDNAERAARRRALSLLSRLGFAPTFVSDEQVAAGVLRSAGYKMVVLPHIVALSQETATAIDDFVHRGGALAVDGDAGQFDGHGKRLGHALRVASDANLSQSDSIALVQLASLMKKCGLETKATIRDANGELSSDVRQYEFSAGHITLVALLADQRVDADAIRTTATVELHSTAFVYDARSGRLLGQLRKIPLEVKSDDPTVLALVRAPLAPSVCKSVFRRNSCSL